MVVSDLTADSCLPIPEDLLVNLNDSYDLISQLLENLPNYFADQSCPSQENSTVPALKAAFNICQHIGGRMLLFQASQSISRIPEMMTKPEDVKDTHTKFSPSNI